MCPQAGYQLDAMRCLTILPNLWTCSRFTLPLHKCQTRRVVLLMPTGTEGCCYCCCAVRHICLFTDLLLMLSSSHLALGCRHYCRKGKDTFFPFPSRQSRQVPATHSIVVSERLLSLPALIMQALHAVRALLNVHVAILGCQVLRQSIPLELECHAGGCA